MIPFFSGAQVREAVSPERALEAVREAFIAYARGEWTMPPKVYVPAYPAGDFRAMPALGAGHALLKWVTSFPGNPAKGLPTVTGLVLLSDATNGMPKAVLDAGAVTSLRTGAAAVLAAETLGRADAETAAVIGAGAKVPHLSYVGDADVGEGANIGAGTIFANYDGVAKHHTDVGAHSFVGSDSVLVAPLHIGDGAYVAAGSTVTMRVEPGELAVARGRQRNIRGWVARRRAGTPTAAAAQRAAEAAGGVAERDQDGQDRQHGNSEGPDA